uniref:Uncharacterized protein n=1 Tax=Amphimedon queenslandica TaxID=400682 RepID=A0A1X7TRA7_AMPQE
MTISEIQENGFIVSKETIFNPSQEVLKVWWDIYRIHLLSLFQNEEIENIADFDAHSLILQKVLQRIFSSSYNPCLYVDALFTHIGLPFKLTPMQVPSSDIWYLVHGVKYVPIYKYFGEEYKKIVARNTQLQVQLEYTDRLQKNLFAELQQLYESYESLIYQHSHLISTYKNLIQEHQELITKADSEINETSEITIHDNGSSESENNSNEVDYALNKSETKDAKKSPDKEESIDVEDIPNLSEYLDLGETSDISDISPNKDPTYAQLQEYTRMHA